MLGRKIRKQEEDVVCETRSCSSKSALTLTFLERIWVTLSSSSYIPINYISFLSFILIENWVSLLYCSECGARSFCTESGSTISCASAAPTRCPTGPHTQEVSAIQSRLHCRISNKRNREFLTINLQRYCAWTFKMRTRVFVKLKFIIYITCTYIPSEIYMYNLCMSIRLVNYLSCEGYSC